MGIYQTLYYPDNTAAEYNKRGKIWYKRAKGSDDQFLPVDSSKNKYLDAYFKKFPMFYQYTTMTKVAGVLSVVLVGYAILKMRKDGKSKL